MVMPIIMILIASCAADSPLIRNGKKATSVDGKAVAAVEISHKATSVDGKAVAAVEISHKAEHKGTIASSGEANLTKHAKKDTTHAKPDTNHAKNDAIVMQGSFESHEDNDEREEDAMLDELEAMTIASMMLKKNWAPAPIVDCKMGSWDEGDCSVTCGTGTVESTRAMTPCQHQDASANPCKNDMCESQDLKKEGVCNQPTCPEPPTEAPTTLPPDAGANRMWSSVGVVPLVGVVAGMLYA